MNAPAWLALASLAFGVMATSAAVLVRIGRIAQTIDDLNARVGRLEQKRGRR